LARLLSADCAIQPTNENAVSLGAAGLRSSALDARSLGREDQDFFSLMKGIKSAKCRLMIPEESVFE
jgi:hypothetical protein